MRLTCVSWAPVGPDKWRLENWRFFDVGPDWDPTRFVKVMNRPKQQRLDSNSRAKFPCVPQSYNVTVSGTPVSGGGGESRRYQDLYHSLAP